MGSGDAPLFARAHHFFGLTKQYLSHFCIIRINILDLFRLDLIRMKTSMDLFLMKKERHSNWISFFSCVMGMSVRYGIMMSKKKERKKYSFFFFYYARLERFHKQTDRHTNINIYIYILILGDRNIIQSRKLLAIFIYYRNQITLVGCGILLYSGTTWF